MRCACERWGPGTTKERQPDTEASNELKKRLEQIRKDREKQDTIWLHPTQNHPSEPPLAEKIVTQDPPKK
jgi:hypothetical protein